MITTKLMLQELSNWTRINRDMLQLYVTSYPYVHYREIDVTNTLRSKISEIINHIITLITSSSIPKHKNAYYKEKTVYSPQ
jgi:hypothetical protein